MKIFSKFGSLTIRFATAANRVYEAKRLTIAQLTELDRIAEAAFSAGKRNPPTPLMKRKYALELAALLRPNLPGAVAADLVRFNFRELLDLALYLGYGDDSDTTAVSPDSENAEPAPEDDSDLHDGDKKNSGLSDGRGQNHVPLRSLRHQGADGYAAARLHYTA